MSEDLSLSGKVSLAAEHNSLSTLLTVPPTDDPPYMIQLTLEKLMVERMRGQTKWNTKIKRDAS